MTTPEQRLPETELTVLKEILRWVRFSGMKEVRSILESSLKDNQKRSVYQLSDGTRGTAEIGTIVGLGAETIRRLWMQWLRLGIGDSIPVKGGDRFKRSFNLEDLGIEVTLPNLPQAKPVPTPPGNNMSPVTRAPTLDDSNAGGTKE